MPGHLAILEVVVMNKWVVIFIVVGGVYWFYTDRTHSVATNTADIEFKYIVKHTGNGSSSDTLPLLVALHGNGDTPSNFYETALDEIDIPARIVVVNGPFKKARGFAWPWSGEEFATYGDAFDSAVENLTSEYPTNGKPVLLGFSGGGSMAYYQAATHGERYAAIFPVSGSLSKKHLGDREIQRKGEVQAYHGKSDSVVGFGSGKNAVNLLRGKGMRVNFTEFEGGHHGIFRQMKTEITDAVESVLVAQ